MMTVQTKQKFIILVLVTHYTAKSVYPRHNLQQIGGPVGASPDARTNMQRQIKIPYAFARRPQS